jgi:hypothetical protein
VHVTEPYFELVAHHGRARLRTLISVATFEQFSPWVRSFWFEHVQVRACRWFHCEPSELSWSCTLHAR